MVFIDDDNNNNNNNNNIIDLIESNPPLYSPVQPTPVYENDKAEAYWDIPVYAESTVVKSNRVDVRIVDKEKKEVLYSWK